MAGDGSPQGRNCEELSQLGTDKHVCVGKLFTVCGSARVLTLALATTRFHTQTIHLSFDNSSFHNIVMSILKVTFTQGAFVTRDYYSYSFNNL